MIEIYHVPGTRSVRVIWTCEELGIDYKIHLVDFGAAYRASTEWRSLNPVGKVPVMKDGDLTIFESGAMVQYLLDRYGEGRLQPVPGTEAHALYLQWNWFAESTFSRPLGEIVNHRRAFAESEQNPAAIEEMRARAHLCMQAVNDALGSNAFLLGDEFSAADIMMGYPLGLIDRLAPTEAYPVAQAYWQRLQKRPGCAVAYQDLG